VTPHSHTHGVCGGLVGDTSLTSPMPGIGSERAKNGVGGRLASDSGGVGCSENGVLARIKTNVRGFGASVRELLQGSA
jgi:hypothetical protein